MNQDLLDEEKEKTKNANCYSLELSVVQISSSIIALFLFGVIEKLKFFGIFQLHLLIFVYFFSFGYYYYYFNYF